MRFIFVRGGRDAALATAGAMSPDRPVAVLMPGETLAWTMLADHTCFAVPLIGQGATATTPSAPVAPAE
jgi:hypothetical protein